PLDGSTRSTDGRPSAGRPFRVGLTVMAHPSEPRFLALHGLRLKGFAEAPVVASAFGLDDDRVAKELDALAEDGLVARREGRISGWSLTPDGRSTHAALAGEELDAAGG